MTTDSGRNQRCLSIRGECRLADATPAPKGRSDAIGAAKARESAFRGGKESRLLQRPIAPVGEGQILPPRPPARHRSGRPLPAEIRRPGRLTTKGYRERKGQVLHPRLSKSSCRSVLRARNSAAPPLPWCLPCLYRGKIAWKRGQSGRLWLPGGVCDYLTVPSAVRDFIASLVAGFAPAADREVRIAWEDPETGGGGLRQIVAVMDIPRAPGKLDDLVSATVNLHPASTVGPTMPKSLLAWGARSHLAFVGLINLGFQSFDPGRLRVPAPRCGHWLQVQNSAQYSDLTPNDLLELFMSHREWKLGGQRRGTSCRWRSTAGAAIIGSHQFWDAGSSR